MSGGTVISRPASPLRGFQLIGLLQPTISTVVLGELTGVCNTNTLFAGQFKEKA
jgi:hypothetical protein